ncbi:MAG: hypothetical protein ACI8Q1_003446 [Parvicella sp.]|jgi:hypothetical protein
MNALRYRTTIIWATSLLIIFVSSCIKPISFPETPAVEFVSFTPLGDSGLISLTFTDGDGDIGLNIGDTTGDFSANSFYHYNLYLEYYEMMEGEWVKGTIDPSGNNFPTGDTINFQFRIKNLTPIGQNKALKGTINVVMEPTYFNPFSNHNDSIKFAITLIDRGLRSSNRLETPLIVR